MEEVRQHLRGPNPAYIPVLVLGECPAPYSGTWSERYGIDCDITRVAQEQHLWAALNTALAKSDTLLLLGSFHSEDMPPLALLTEMLARSLLVEENKLVCRLIGQADETNSGAVIYTQGVRLYVCSAVGMRQEKVLKELRAHINSVPAKSPSNVWLLPTQPGQNTSTQLSKNTSMQPGKNIPTQPVTNAANQRAPDAPVPRTHRRQTQGFSLLLALLTVACLAFCAGVGYLIYYAADSGLQEARNRQVQALYPVAASQDEPQDTNDDQNETPESFEALRGLNSDCVGWLKIPGAEVSQPVMLETTNDYYLAHDVQRNRSRFGALFLDSDNEVSTSGQSRNLSIFGHNTKNGTMFGQLYRYRDLAFYRQNSVFRFDTLFARRQWVVFAVFITNADPAQDDGAVFEWRAQSAAAPENIMDFVDALKQRSIIRTGVDVRPGDELLSLTTCTYEIKNGRLVIFARALRQGESPPDTTRATINPAPLYPAAWYINYGGEKPKESADFG